VSGLALAGLCVLLLPMARRRGLRRELRGLLMVVAAAAGMSVMTGCGGGSRGVMGSPNCAAVVPASTTGGGYVVTITGKSGGITQSTSFSVTVK
jgi:hypothetical protein